MPELKVGQVYRNGEWMCRVHVDEDRPNDRQLEFIRAGAMVDWASAIDSEVAAIILSGWTLEVDTPTQATHDAAVKLADCYHQPKGTSNER